MRKTLDTIDIMVCIDCGLYIANGETEDCDPTWNYEVIDRAWPGYHIVSGDSDKDDEFSWQRCDTCFTRPGGARMHCVAIAD